MRQRALPWTAGDRQGAPERVRAPQRGALARMVGCFDAVFKSQPHLPELIAQADENLKNKKRTK
jgi:hypothetical protein